MISIIIPCYNHNEEVVRAVGSALAQRNPKEIILVDDGSLTPVRNIWGNAVKIIRQDNKGLSNALNTGIAASRGESFVILAADDMLHPEYIGVMSQYTKKADIISCDFSPNGKGRVKAKPGSLKLLMAGNCHTYAALVKKEMWKKVGGFKETMNPSWEDWEFWLNCAKHGATWQHVPMPLHFYYRNPIGRDAEAQGKDYLLRAKLEGYHQDLFGKGRGVVTFIIPCYNHEEYLGEAIESALAQIYPHIRVIVVDDGSPGPIEDVVKDYPVVLIRQDNKHLSAARNTGIRYAIDIFNSQFIIPLDADDKVNPDYVEKTLAAFQSGYYVYTDVKLYGDAWHVLPMPDYDANKIVKKHLHPCTILYESTLWEDLVNTRGYGYDESMKRGYEDWEFALAALKKGYCGIRVPEPLFFYRNYANGTSMRSDAAKINDDLVSYINKQHPWMKEEVMTRCRSCGGRQKFRTTVNPASKAQMVDVPGVGMVDSREPITIEYLGTEMRTITKVGRGLPGKGNSVYKFTANPNTISATDGKINKVFNAFAGDAHLFVGPFKFSRFIPPPPTPEIKVPDPETMEKAFAEMPPEAVIDLREPPPKKKGRPKKKK